MGKPSCSILLHEITKLLVAAGVTDPVYIRMGTCGGLGLAPGTVAISTQCLNGMLSPNFQVAILGKVCSSSRRRRRGVMVRVKAVVVVVVVLPTCCAFVCAIITR